MNISDDGLALIKNYESKKYRAYPDPGSGGAPWTIGYGHTGPEVYSGLVWSDAQIDAQLRTDVSKYSSVVNRFVTVGLQQCQFDALVCLAFNIGGVNFQSSTLVRLLNSGDSEGAQNQFPRWNKASGKVMKGLVRRRAAEAALFGGSSVTEAIQAGLDAAP